LSVKLSKSPAHFWAIWRLPDNSGPHSFLNGS
jgi:hypothetical protein